MIGDHRIRGRGQGAWPPFGAVLVSGKDWFDGQGVDVMSNGRWGCVDDCKLWSGYGPEWQCVELVDRFIVTKHWSPEVYADAWEFYDRAPAAYFEKHPNGSGYMPVPGDIIVWHGGASGFGHVAVVDWVEGSRIGWVEQDDSTNGRASASLGPNDALGPYGAVIPTGFLHAKANQPPPPLQGSSPSLQGSAPELQGSNQPVQGGQSNSGGGSPSPTPAPSSPPPTKGFTIEDSIYGGTWARFDPNDGTWYPHSSTPPNGKYWFPNGLGVAVDCARSAAAYSVSIYGRHETWSWWAHVTDNTWVPVAVFSTVWSDGNPGVANC